MNTRIAQLLPKFASIAVGLVPVFVLISFFGVPRKLIIGWGGLSYLVGVLVFKMPTYHLLVVRILHRHFSHRSLAVSQGFVSALSELGSAFLFFLVVVPDLTLVQLIGFGAAAGAVEAVILPFIKNPLQGTPVGDHAEEVGTKAGRSGEWMGVVERVLAMIPHVCCRGLVYITVVTGNPLPSVLGVLSFAAIDGRAYFGLLEKWAFDDIRILRKLYYEIGMVALFQIVYFSLFYREYLL